MSSPSHVQRPSRAEALAPAAPAPAPVPAPGAGPSPGDPAATADFKITPDEVECPGGIDYSRVVNMFGLQLIDEALIARVESLTGQPAHPFLKRGLFFAHRDLNAILDAYEAGEPFFLYTGRGPSRGSLHLGHVIPFEFTRYLQDAFRVPVVIQLTDDEKFLKKDLSEEEVRANTRSTIEDILAIGFDPELTHIFTNFDSIGRLYPMVCRIQRHLTCNQVIHTFGVGLSESVGKLAFPAIQMAPCFSSTFPIVLSSGKADIGRAAAAPARTAVGADAGAGESRDESKASDASKAGAASALADAGHANQPRRQQPPHDESSRGAKPHTIKPGTSGAGKRAGKRAAKRAGKRAGKRNARGVRCLIPCGIDQDPYFRLTRDVAKAMGKHKPAVVHAKFLPSLDGIATKMSSTPGAGAAARASAGPIFLSDTRKQVAKKMGRAFSGGRVTLEEHRRLGADLSVDVPVKYLSLFMHDTAAFDDLCAAYAAGKLTSGEVKKVAVGVIMDLLRAFQTRRAAVTPALVQRVMARRPLF